MTLHIALLPGDGVGSEVLAEAKKAIDALAETGALSRDLEWSSLAWGSDFYAANGRMMAEDWEERLRAHDAVLMGACGWPLIPDHVSLWGMILAIRQGLDLWANVRPVRLLPGIASPLAGRGAGDIDMIFVRENSEGEYSGVGGRVHRG